MKRFSTISAVLIIYATVLLLPNYGVSIVNASQAKLYATGCGLNIPEKQWIENQRDNDPFESGQQYFEALLKDLSFRNSICDLHEMPLRHSLLNPLFTDRPPPTYGY